MSWKNIIMISPEKLKPHPINEKIYQPREDQAFGEHFSTVNIQRFPELNMHTFWW